MEFYFVIKCHILFSKKSETHLSLFLKVQRGNSRSRNEHKKYAIAYFLDHFHLI